MILRIPSVSFLLQLSLFSSLQRSTACLLVNEVLASLSQSMLVVLVRTSRILRLSQVFKNFVEQLLLRFGFNLNSHYFARHCKAWVNLTAEMLRVLYALTATSYVVT